MEAYQAYYNTNEVANAANEAQFATQSPASPSQLSKNGTPKD